MHAPLHAYMYMYIVATYLGNNMRVDCTDMHVGLLMCGQYIQVLIIMNKQRNHFEFVLLINGN